MHEALPPPPMPNGADAYGAYWDEAAAAAAVAFFPTYLRHTEGEWAGRPFVLQPWQRDRIIRPVYGWKRADGSRLIRTVWIEVPKKNGKTELAAGCAHLALMGDGEFGGQVYSMAVDKNQAKIVFNKAATMANLSEDLKRHLEVYKASIFCPELLARFEPLGAGARNKDGFNPSAAIGDEVHQWTDGGEVAQMVHQGTIARRQPLEWYITTAGVKGEGYAWEMHELAEGILSGDIVDPTMHVVIFAMPDTMDWRTEEAWRAANPNYGISVKQSYMAENAAKAARSPRAENEFKRYHLNIWTEQVTRWLPMDGGEDGRGWNDCTADPADRYLWQRLPGLNAGRACHAGLDLSLTRDLTSLCLRFEPLQPGGRVVFIWRFWLPREAVRQAPLALRKRYEHFAEQGALKLTDGNVTDFATVRADIQEDAKTFAIQWLGIDRYNAAQLATELKDQDGIPVEYFGQGYVSMSPPSKGFERMVLSGSLEHGNNPVARWMAGNAAVEEDAAGNIKPTKGKAAGKIDGIVAAIMAEGGAATGKVAEDESFPGLVILG